MEDMTMSPPLMAEIYTIEVASILVMFMVTGLIVLFFILAFCFVPSIYAKWYLSRTSQRANQETPRRVSRRRRRGLDRATLESLPMVEYDPKEDIEVMECSVCLSETIKGENVRFLPNCNHGFHLECIDMWFKSHSTCPLCRNSISTTKISSDDDESQEMQVLGGSSRVFSDSDSDSDSDSSSESEVDDHEYESVIVVHSREVLAFPTNVLFWGNEAQIRTLLEGSNTNVVNASTSSISRPRGDQLVIDIPRDLSNDEEAKTPMVSRLRSLTRLLSRGTTRVAPWASGSGSGSSSGELV